MTLSNLRLCHNLSYASLIATYLAQQRICTVSHVNTTLQQVHWRSRPGGASSFDFAFPLAAAFVFDFAFLL